MEQRYGSFKSNSVYLVYVIYALFFFIFITNFDELPYVLIANLLLFSS